MNQRNTKKEKIKRNKGFPYKSKVEQLKKELRVAELINRAVKNDKEIKEKEVKHGEK